MSNENWLDEFAEMDVASGTFLPIANGFLYKFTIYLEKKPEKVQKEYQGKPSGHKFQWKVKSVDIGVQNQNYVDVLAIENEDKLKKISSFEKNIDAILELAPTFTKQLSQFIKDNNVTNKTIISMYRQGSKNKTEYFFEIVK